jgi:hypothetical protein
MPLLIRRFRVQIPGEHQFGSCSGLEGAHTGRLVALPPLVA